jgi:hypothetical protein
MQQITDGPGTRIESPSDLSGVDQMLAMLVFQRIELRIPDYKRQIESKV